jgi:hypothetical protein
MFGKSLIKNKKHRLLAVRKNNIYYCASYDMDNDDYCEVITSINTGEKFYSLASFVQSIIGLKSVNEFNECLYYSNNKKKWRPVKYLFMKY